MPVLTQRRRALRCLCGTALGALAAAGPAWCQRSMALALQQPVTKAPGADKIARHAVLAHAGSDQVLVVDNATLNAVGRYVLRTALRVAPVFSPDGEHAFFIGEGGWFSRLDLCILQIEAERHHDFRAQRTAISGDGQYLAIADDDACALTILDANLAVLKRLPVTSRDGQRRSRIQSIQTAPTRQSFVVALRDLPEVWEISYNPTTPNIPMGVIHDFQYREGAFAPGFLNPMRTTLVYPVEDLVLREEGNDFIVTANETTEAALVHLDVRRPIARWPQAKKLRWNAGYAWGVGGHSVLAAPTQDGRAVMVVKLEDGQTVRSIPVLGRPRQIESHVSANHLWVVTEDSANTLTIIDKRTLDVVSQQAIPTDAPIEALVFSNDGQRVYVRDTADTVRVFDEKSRREVKRLDFRDPSVQSGRLTAH